MGMGEGELHILAREERQLCGRLEDEVHDVGREPGLLAQLQRRPQLGTDEVGEEVADEQGQLGRRVERAEVDLRDEQHADERSVEQAHTPRRRRGERLSQHDGREEEQRRRHQQEMQLGRQSEAQQEADGAHGDERGG